VPQIEVTFDIDANGIVHVSAKDLGTGKEQKIRIESSSGLSEDEIKRMVRDAESHAAEDRLERERAEVRNAADSLLYATQKSVRELAEKLTDEDKDAVEKASAELRAALVSEDLSLIRGSTEALEKVAHRLAEKVYNQASGKSSSAESSTTGNGGGGQAGRSNGKAGPTHAAEDADYEVVDDGKKKQ
jgi:molecular chaperone DnaK